MPSLVPAAGTLPWRRRDGRLEVALVHRPKYDDWSWAKGKLDPGEHASVAAARETLEETGLVVRLGRPLPLAEYPILDPTGAPTTKRVHYWAASVTGGSGSLIHEIDEVAWVDVRTANDRLDYARDREQLLALVRAERAGELDTWPLALVRHAKSVPRSKWKQDDPLRPLDAVGRAQARAVAQVLAAYGIVRLASSPSVRCTATLEPYAVAQRLRVRERPALSEELHEQSAADSVREVAKLLVKGQPAALCSHGPVLPALLESLVPQAGLDRTDPPLLEAAAPPVSAPATPPSVTPTGTVPPLSSVPPVVPDRTADTVAERLAEAADAGMRKGEVLVCHVHGRGPAARIVDVERIDT
ncbi:MAG: putative phosphohistidine phosphatase, SixA [Humibacillus sp.]|nr:putative phosphohistidine phosphatase, SixA [Humibacillus sp.]